MTDKKFQDLIEKYIDDFKQIYLSELNSGQTTPELSYRPVLDNLFRNIPKILKNNFVEIIFEPTAQKKSGRPDWRFHHSKSMGIYGYVEAKGFDPKKTIDWKPHSKQIKKYLALGYKIIFTDGIDFFFFNPKNPDNPQSVSLIKKPLKIKAKWNIAKSIPKTKSLFSQFFLEPSSRTITDEQLIVELATRSKNLSEDIMSLVSLNPDEGVDKFENKAILALHSIKKTLESEHDPFLESNERFAKAVSQIMVFGVFYAHRHLSKSQKKPNNLRKSLHRFWIDPIATSGENKLRPFRALAEILEKTGKQLSGINLWYSDCVLLLSYIKLSKKQRTSPNYHELYEKFLKHFDPQDKIDFGAYATPNTLASFMIGFSEQISKNIFKDSIFQSKNKIIEPCCGTGTFLEEISKYVSKHRLGKNKFPTVAGFEILAAPYALSQYRLYQLKNKLPLAESITILLCNTLSDKITTSKIKVKSRKRTTTAKILFNDEYTDAVKMAKPPITLVIGNPPSSDAGLHTDKKTSKQILKLIEDFRPPKYERTIRQNIQKQMQNDFIKFLRWACLKIKSNKLGMISFILPSSFLQHQSYTFARKWISKNFSNVWILEIDRDGRTGVHTSNIFDTLQGRCILFCSQTTGKNQTKTIEYASVIDMEKSKKLSFLTNMLNKINQKNDISKFFSTLQLEKETQYAFKPSISYDNKHYSKFWKLTTSDSSNDHIFERHSSGVKLGITSALTHLDRNQLSRRTREISNTSTSFDDLKEKWFQGHVKPPREENLSPKIRNSINSVVSTKSGLTSNIKRYSFRPFINSYAFLSEKILKELSNEGGRGTRYRPEVISAFSDKNNFGISVAPSPVDLGDKIQRFSSFCWNIPDNDLCTRGNGHVFCTKFPEYQRKNWNKSNKNNINNRLETLLIKNGIKKSTIENDLIFYVYAILSSNFFLDKFEGALYSTSGNWPRIPIFKETSIFQKLSKLGKSLAECEKDLKQSKKVKILPTNGIKLKKFNIDEKLETITLTDYDSNTYIVLGFDKNCLIHSISGYSIFTEYLKRNTWSYLRRNFTNEDTSQLYSLNSALNKQFKIIKDIDEILKNSLKKSKISKTLLIS